MTMKILLPIDGTPLSLHQVRFAIQLALQGLKAEFLLANVQEPANFYEIITARDPAALQDLATAAGRDLLAPAIQMFQASGLPHEVMILHDSAPIQGMLDLIETQNCNMVIIAEHNPDILHRWGLNSSASRLARVAPVPVLSVKTPPADDEP